jgi:thioesterase domain-containing protein
VRLCRSGCTVSDRPTLSTVETLTQVWERVLRRSPIGPEDNFFDLGGTDPQADALFAEIAQECGRMLPSATICHAPTIAALTALLEKPTLPCFSPFVPLRAGSRKPPILIAHGVGGRASFSELAKHIHAGHAIYGIQARGVDGMEEPFESIEDMAQLYLDALNELQPQGPYILLGYSFGGLVALEMAQRLSRDGKEIALLVLMDTYPHPRYFPAGQRLWLAAKKANGHLANMKRMPIGAAFSYLVRGIKRRLGGAKGHDHGALATEPHRLSFAQTTAHVKESDFRALARYRPRFYEGKIKFVRPETNSYLPNNPTALWKSLVSELEVETVPGDHLGMVGKHFEKLAAVLTRYVEESGVAKSNRK